MASIPSNNLPEENNRITISQVEKELIQADPKVFEGVDYKKKERIKERCSFNAKNSYWTVTFSRNT